jgi:hypothetical protein
MVGLPARVARSLIIRGAGFYLEEEKMENEVGYDVLLNRENGKVAVVSIETINRDREICEKALGVFGGKEETLRAIASDLGKPITNTNVTLARHYLDNEECKNPWFYYYLRLLYRNKSDDFGKMNKMRKEATKLRLTYNIMKKLLIQKGEDEEDVLAYVKASIKNAEDMGEIHNKEILK